jgi:cell division septal protein FtsQ
LASPKTRSRSRSETRRRTRKLRLISLGALVLIALSLLVFHGSLSRAAAGELVTLAERFRVKSIHVSGERLLTTESVLHAANIALGTPMYHVSADAVEARLRTHQWIKSARVTRRFPDTIAISITEREPIAAIRQQPMAIITADSVAVMPPSDQWVWDLPLLLPPHAVQIALGKPLRDTETLALLREAVIVRRVSTDSWQNLSELYYRGDDMYASLARPAVEVRLGQGVSELAWIALASYLTYGEDRPPESENQVIDLRFSGKVIVSAGRPTEERENG